MPKSPTRSKKTFVERALEGMTKRLEAGESLAELEVPLYVMMLHAHNSRELLNYEEAFEAVRQRIANVEAHLRTQQNIRKAMEGGRRVPPQNVGPPNQDPFNI